MEQLPEATVDGTEVMAPNAYPPSIQPGIPMLGKTPAGWVRLAMGDLLEPVLRPANLKNDEEYQLVTAKRNRGGIVPRKRLYGRDIKTKAQYFLEGGDFLISRRQISHGACGLVPTSLSGAIVSNEYSALKPKSDLDVRFLQHLTHSVYFQQTCFHSSVGIHVEKLVFKLEDWFDWEFDIPPVTEQRQIADVLDAWDRAISAIEALIEAKNSRYAGLLQKIFGELQSHKHVPFSSLADFNVGSVPESTDPSTRIRYFDLASATSEDVEDLSGWITFGEAPSRARRTAEPGDVIYGTVRPLLRRLFLAPNEPSAVYSTGYAVLHPRDRHFANFILHLLRSRPVERQIFASLTGSGYPAISVRDLGDVEVPLLREEEQAAIARVLDVAAGSVDSDTQLVVRLRRQKRGLLQKLLKGEWRLDSGKAPIQKPVRAAS